jgi:hypothetical protein
MRLSILIMTLALATNARADTPETVVVTYSPQPGKEPAVEKLIRDHWAAVVRLHLVTGDPHLLYRDVDKDGLPIFVDILTWKSHAAPDNAPPEIEAIWAKMEAAVVKRGERRGIEFHEVQRLR